MVILVNGNIQNFKQELIDKNILELSGVKKFDNIVDKWKQTKNKKIVFKNVGAKVGTQHFDIYKIFKNYLNEEIDYRRINMIKKSIKDGIKIYQETPLTDRKKRIIDNSYKVIRGINLFISMIDNDEFKIYTKYYAGPNNNFNLDWMNDNSRRSGFSYMKKSNGNELKLIKDFITKINNGSINNKNKGGNEFRKLKQKVTSDRLKQDLIKNLERYIFGEDIESIEPEEKYDERVQIRKQNTQKKDYFKEAADYLKYIEEQEKGQKRFSDDYDSNGWSSGSWNVVSKSKGAGLKISNNKQMLNSLPILLAQIQAGNNSIKLKNEARQILYSLYRSKLLTKTVYNNLIKSIR